MDPFDPSPAQVYHPILTAARHPLSLKSYPFSSYTDPALKRAVYEIWLYGELRSASPLIDYFIMSRSQTHTMVLIFKNYESSLFEIVRYRQLADHPWTHPELLTLWKTLIANYRQLASQSIAHRDLRLSNVLFTPDSRSQPFQLANLANARKVTRAEASDLLTVVGVSVFAEPPLRDKIESGAVLASYDPFAYDAACLARLLLSTLNLNPLESGELPCRNPELQRVIERVRGESPRWGEIEKELEGMLRGLVFEKGELFRDDRVISEHLSRS